MKVMPSVPTLHELGVKDVDCVGWWALMAPRGIPDPIKQKLRGAFLDMARSSKTEEFLVKAGTDPFILDGDEAQEFFLKEIENWRRYVKIAKMEAKG
jgi:tripartite-type tricarboxylate transporter receptor subunit TctC